MSLNDWRSNSRRWEQRAKQSRKQIDKIITQLERVQHALSRNDLETAAAMIGRVIVEAQENN